MMSASSSSDCECECDLYYHNYNNYSNYSNYQTYTPLQPLYPELGHPFIYYTQVQKKQRPQQGGKNKNNCFAKAFRWYTEEHVSLRKTESGERNEVIQGFAAWLDQKYDEYLRKSQITQMNSSQFLLKPTSSIRTNKQNVVYETSVPRKKKMKSPWRRRQRNLNKQNGDSIKKSEQSIEFILNPKNLSRSASEFCQKCHRSNNAILADTNTVNSKSESVIYIVKEKELCVIPFDDNDTTTDKKNSNYDKMNVNNGQLKGKPAKDISCQCSITKLDNVNASSQVSQKTSNAASYTNSANKRMNCIHSCCLCFETQPGTNQKVLKEDQNVPVSTVHPSAVSQKSVQNILVHSAIVPRETSFAADKNIEKSEHSFSVNGMAQTSDQAINLSSILNPEYPMFLKIICAHK